jgi:hypothetical protein
LALFFNFLISRSWRNASPLLAHCSVYTSATAGLTLFGFWLIARWLYDSHGLWISVATPALGSIASTFAVLLVTSASERRQRRFVQGALGMYTSPALVKELIEHPEHLTLEWGQKREMTVYFSDIAGFTTISEGLTPDKLVALLNDYLTHMTDLVLTIAFYCAVVRVLATMKMDNEPYYKEVLKQYPIPGVNWTCA